MPVTIKDGRYDNFYMPPNLISGVWALLVSACHCVRASVCASFQNQARVLKFYVLIPH